jgi:hypothetical protein
MLCIVVGKFMLIHAYLFSFSLLLIVLLYAEQKKRISNKFKIKTRIIYNIIL